MYRRKTRADDYSSNWNVRLRPKLHMDQFTRLRSAEPFPWGSRQDPFAGAFSLGRDALWNIAMHSMVPNKSCVWLPAYCCDQLVSPFAAAGLELRFYDVNSDLTVDWSALLSACKRHKSRSHALVLVDYFGYALQVSDELRAEFRQSFDIVVRDAAHSLPVADIKLLHGRKEGYLVFSLRKLLPIPDLALVFASNGEGKPIQFAEPRRSTWRRWLFVWFETAGLMFPHWAEHSIYSRGRQWLKESKTMGMAAANLSTGTVGRISMEHVVRARRSNALQLSSAFTSSTLFKDVPQNACPYLFPIVCEQREKVQAEFTRRRIETTTFWRIRPERGVKYPGARRISETVLCLPVHQDLDEEGMSVLLKTAEAVV